MTASLCRLAVFPLVLGNEDVERGMPLLLEQGFRLFARRLAAAVVTIFSLT
jgi:hypothetical protein